MGIVLEHFNCKNCGKDKFHVVLEEDKSFAIARIEKIICSKCGLIYENVREKKKRKGERAK